MTAHLSKTLAFRYERASINQWIYLYGDGGLVNIIPMVLWRRKEFFMRICAIRRRSEGFLGMQRNSSVGGLAVLVNEIT
jgi:hypothetical protein